MYLGNSEGNDQEGNKDGKRHLEGIETAAGGDRKMPFVLRYKRVARRSPGVVLFGRPAAKAEGIVGGQEGGGFAGDDHIDVVNAGAGGFAVAEDVRGGEVVNDACHGGSGGGWESASGVAGDGAGSGAEG